MGAGRAIPAGLAALCLAAAVLPALFGVNLVSYALGNPDTPRYFVGLYALVGLGAAGALLHVAGLQLRRLGWQPPYAAPVLGALAVLPLIVLSLPLQYDQDPPFVAVLAATAGVVLGGAALSARTPHRAPPVGLAALGAFYLTCLLLDGASLLPDPPPSDARPPSRSPQPVLPTPG